MTKIKLYFSTSDSTLIIFLIQVYNNCWSNENKDTGMSGFFWGKFSK